MKTSYQIIVHDNSSIDHSNDIKYGLLNSIQILIWLIIYIIEIKGFSIKSIDYFMCKANFNCR